MTDSSTDRHLLHLTHRKKNSMERCDTIHELELAQLQSSSSQAATCMPGNIDGDSNDNDQASTESSDQYTYKCYPELEETSGDNENYESNGDDNDDDDEMEETDVQLKKSLLKHLSEQNEANKIRRIARRTKLKAKREQELSTSETKLATRAKAREMTPSQEMWNVVTMIPCPVYFAFFMIAGQWLKEEDVQNMREMMSDATDINDFKYGGDGDEFWSVTTTLHNMFSNENGCIQSQYFPNLYALPPTALIVSALGATLHAPCSMLYHALCACYLPSGPKRMDHWSRRLDQAMIHFVSLCWCYASSGNKDFALASAAFNLDSMYRLFQDGYRPGRLIIRMAVAFVLPAFPFLVRGEFSSFGKLMAIYAVSFWLFSQYPFGGRFHI